MKNAATAFLAVLVAIFVLARIVGPDDATTDARAHGSDAAAATHVDGSRARALVRGGGLLLDVRTPDEFAAGHLDGAVNVPVQELERRLAEVPRDRDVVVYCRSGARSAAASALLVENGVRTFDLGPMSAW